MTRRPSTPPTCTPARPSGTADQATVRTLLAVPIRHLLALGPIDGHLGLRITNAYLAAFLDHTLQGRDEPEPLLTGKSATYPQVRAQRTPG